MNYSTTYLYRITCKDSDIKLYYVGYTTDFRRRKYQHKLACTDMSSKNYDELLYKTIRRHGGWENWDMILIDTLSLKLKLEAHKEKCNYIEQCGIDNNINYLAGFKVFQRRDTDYTYLFELKCKKYLKDIKKEKVTCELCHSTVSRGHLPSHLDTYKCMEIFINTI